MSDSSGKDWQPLCVVLKGYPRLSETFIAQEIHNLTKAGFEVTIFSLRHPTDNKVHPIHNEINSKVVYLPEYLYQEPLRVFKSWWKVRGTKGYRNARNIWLKDLLRDKTPNRIRRFGQAMVMAAELPDHYKKIYSHFLHTPSSVARYTSKILDIPWACSAHAKDIWTNFKWDIEEKLADCQWLTTCTRYNVDYLSEIAVDSAKVKLNYHGIDLSRFSRPAAITDENYGADPDKPVIILSVGRAVPKKGYDGLLNALQKLPSTLNWQFIHIGGGPLLDQLKQQATALKIDHKVSWRGSASQQEVIAAYQSSDIFALNSQIVDDGDRDGLPNVLIEAQSQALPVVSTTISGIPELVENEANGLLVEPNQEDALSAALSRLIQDPALRISLGQTGQRKVFENFDMMQNIHQLVTDLKAL